MKTRQNDPLERHEQDLAGWDIDDYAHRIQYEAGTSPELRSISVSLTGHRTRAPETVTLGAKWPFQDSSSDDEDGEGEDGTNKT